MTGPSRRRANRTRRQGEDEREAEEDDADAEALDPDDLDPDDLIRTADGELMHEETGLIVDEDRVDPGPEWRAFTHSERQSKSRVGAPTTQTMHDKGLT
ncbi:MAG: transcription initiation factor IIB 3, partial [Haloferacaceae archaeon]